MQNQIPTFKQIYSNDVSFKSLIQLIYGPLIFLIGVSIVEPMFRLIIAAFTIPLSLIGVIASIYWYKSIQSTFRDGITVKGKMLFRENIVTNTSKNSSSSQKRSYYITVGYQVSGVEYQQRIRLPDAPYFYGINHEGQEFDLVLKEATPQNVLIKHVYLDYDPNIPNE
ncbi:MAG: hypothetical protein UZ14_CFX002001196 [Chloroflexi bacterium OLB14]|nr:MAG: hypothetical protein UZ14_CFX002001196 [Chloroflexi bacterium OLB14]